MSSSALGQLGRPSSTISKQDILRQMSTSGIDVRPASNRGATQNYSDLNGSASLKQSVASAPVMHSVPVSLAKATKGATDSNRAASPISSAALFDSIIKDLGLSTAMASLGRQASPTPPSIRSHAPLGESTASSVLNQSLMRDPTVYAATLQSNALGGVNFSQVGSRAMSPTVGPSIVGPSVVAHSTRGTTPANGTTMRDVSPSSHSEAHFRAVSHSPSLTVGTSQFAPRLPQQGGGTVRSHPHDGMVVTVQVDDHPSPLPTLSPPRTAHSQVGPPMTQVRAVPASRSATNTAQMMTPQQQPAATLPRRAHSPRSPTQRSPSRMEQRVSSPSTINVSVSRTPTAYSSHAMAAGMSPIMRDQVMTEDHAQRRAVLALENIRRERDELNATLHEVRRRLEDELARQRVEAEEAKAEAEVYRRSLQESESRYDEGKAQLERVNQVLQTIKNDARAQQAEATARLQEQGSLLEVTTQTNMKLKEAVDRLSAAEGASRDALRASDEAASEQLSSLAALLSQERAGRDAAEGQVSRLDQQLSALRDTHEATAAELVSLEAERSTLRSAMTRLEGELVALKVEGQAAVQKANTEAKTAAEATARQHSQRILVVEEAKQDLEELLSQTRAALQRSHQDSQTVKARADEENRGRRAAELKVVELSEKVKELGETLMNKTTELDETSRRLHSSQESNVRLANNLEKLERSTSDRIEDLNVQVATLSATLQTTQNSLSTSQAELSALASEHAELIQLFNRTEAERVALEEARTHTEADARDAKARALDVHDRAGKERAEIQEVLRETLARSQAALQAAEDAAGERASEKITALQAAHQEELARLKQKQTVLQTAVIEAQEQVRREQGALESRAKDLEEEAEDLRTQLEAERSRRVEEVASLEGKLGQATAELEALPPLRASLTRHQEAVEELRDALPEAVRRAVDRTRREVEALVSAEAQSKLESAQEEHRGEVRRLTEKLGGELKRVAAELVQTRGESERTRSSLEIELTAAKKALEGQTGRSQALMGAVGEGQEALTDLSSRLRDGELERSRLAFEAEAALRKVSMLETERNELLNDRRHGEEEREGLRLRVQAMEAQLKDLVRRNAIANQSPSRNHRPAPVSGSPMIVDHPRSFSPQVSPQAHQTVFREVPQESVRNSESQLAIYAPAAEPMDDIVERILADTRRAIESTVQPASPDRVEVSRLPYSRALSPPPRLEIGTSPTSGSILISANRPALAPLMPGETPSEAPSRVLGLQQPALVDDGRRTPMSVKSVLKQSAPSFVEITQQQLRSANRSPKPRHLSMGEPEHFTYVASPSRQGVSSSPNSDANVRVSVSARPPASFSPSRASPPGLHISFLENPADRALIQISPSRSAPSIPSPNVSLLLRDHDDAQLLPEPSRVTPSLRGESPARSAARSSPGLSLRPTSSVSIDRQGNVFVESGEGFRFDSPSVQVEVARPDSRFSLSSALVTTNPNARRASYLDPSHRLPVNPKPVQVTPLPTSLLLPSAVRPAGDLVDTRFRGTKSPAASLIGGSGLPVSHLYSSSALLLGGRPSSAAAGVLAGSTLSSSSSLRPISTPGGLLDSAPQASRPLPLVSLPSADVRHHDEGVYTSGSATTVTPTAVLAQGLAKDHKEASDMSSREVTHLTGHMQALAHTSSTMRSGASFDIDSRRREFEKVAQEAQEAARLATRTLEALGGLKDI